MRRGGLGGREMWRGWGEVALEQSLQCEHQNIARRILRQRECRPGVIAGAVTRKSACELLDNWESKNSWGQVRAAKADGDDSGRRKPTGTMRY